MWNCDSLKLDNGKKTRESKGVWNKKHGRVQEGGE